MTDNREPARRGPVAPNTAKRRPDEGGMQIVSRIAAILRALQGRQMGLSLGQIAKATGLPRATVQRIVNALELEQFVAADVVNGGLLLGSTVTHLAAGAYSDFKSSVRPLIEELCRKVGETVVLTTIRHGRITFVDQVASDQPFHMVISPSIELSPCYSAAGKAQLACMSREEALAVIPTPLDPPTGKGARTIDAVLADIEAVKQSGIAYDMEEVSEGACAMAMAVRDETGAAYCLTITAPSVRYYKNEAMMRDELVNTCRQIESLCRGHLKAP